MQNRKKRFCGRILAFVLAFILCFSGMSEKAFAAGNKTNNKTEEKSIESETANTVKLSKTEGTVAVTKSSGKSVKITKNMRLFDGYHVATEEKSYAWQELDKSKLIKEDAISEVEIRKSGKLLEILLNSGSMFFNVTEKLEDDETMNICTSSMIAGIRGTCGWVSVIDSMTTRIYLLEGKLECIVVDPITGQAKKTFLNAGEWADFRIYDKYQKGDKCDIIRDRFVREEVPGFVLVELVGDQKRCQEIFEASGIDLRDVTEKEAGEKLAQDEEKISEKMRALELEIAKLENNISKDPVWADNSAAPQRKPAPAPTAAPGATPEPAAPAAPAILGTPVSVDTTPAQLQDMLDDGDSVTVQPDAKSNIYRIDSDLHIPAGTTLTIDAGMTLVVSPGVTVTVDGTLVAKGDVENNGNIIINSGESMHVTGSLINNGSIVAQSAGLIDAAKGIDNYGTITISGASTMFAAVAEGTVRQKSNTAAIVVSGGDLTNKSTGAALALEEASQIGNVTFTSDTLLQALSDNVLTVGGQKLGVDSYTVTYDPESQYYQFRIDVKTVTFMGGTGSTTKEVKVINGFPVGSALPALSRVGYELTGFNTAADGTGTAFTAATVVTADTTVYAQWKSNNGQHTVTLNTNGGVINGGNVLTVDHNDTITLPAVVPPDGYAFYGWYTAPDSSGSPVKENEPVTANEIYYARFVNDNGTITIQMIEDPASELEPETQAILPGSKLARPADPTRVGYTFDGWYMDEDCETEVDFDAPVYTEISIYAKWNINTYTVSFDTTGGDEVGNIYVDYGNSTDTLPIEVNKTGYTFAGWYTDAACTKPYDEEAPVTGDLQLFAKWNINTYTVSFDTGEGSAVEPQNIIYQNKATRPGVAPTRTGYDFAGWYTDATYKTAYDFAGMVITDDITIYAKWSTKSYTVSFDTGDGSKVDSQTVAYMDHASKPMVDPTKTGHDFAGWYVDELLETEYDFADMAIMGDTTIYAKWTLHSYTVSFDTVGGSTVDDQLVEYGSTITAISSLPVKTGYTLAGWYKDAAYGERFDATTPITADITVYAKWNINTYTVSFETGEEVSSVAAQTIEYQKNATKPTDPTRTGYDFVGWYTSDTYTTEFNFTGTAITADTTVYAKWNIHSYTVSFDTSGGSTVAPQTVEYQKNATKPATDPTRTGYDFAGWYVDEVFETEYDFDYIEISEDTTIYAKWNIKTFTVTFDANGGKLGTLDTVTTDVDYDTAATLPATDPVRAGYDFTGWYTDDELLNLYTNFGITENKTLYAGWAIKHFTVTFDLGVEGVTNPTESVEFNKTATKPATDPTRTGYDFVDWYVDSDLLDEFDFTTAITADTTIYAKWEVKMLNVTWMQEEDEEDPMVFSVEYGETIDPLVDVFKDGFVLDYWRNGTAEYDFSTPVTTDLVLYAVWGYDLDPFVVSGGTYMTDYELEYTDSVTLRVLTNEPLTIWNIDPETPTEASIEVVGPTANITFKGINIANPAGVAVDMSSSSTAVGTITLAFAGDRNKLAGTVAIQDTGAGKLVITGTGSLEATASLFAILTQGDLEITGGEIKATMTTPNPVFSVAKNITVSGSSTDITFSGGTLGFDAGNRVTITDATIQGSGTSYGIYAAGDLVSLTNVTAHLDCYGGIESQGKVVITDSEMHFADDASKVAEDRRGDIGVRAADDITVTGSTIYMGAETRYTSFSSSLLNYGFYGYDPKYQEHDIVIEDSSVVGYTYTNVFCGNGYFNLRVKNSRITASAYDVAVNVRNLYVDGDSTVMNLTTSDASAYPSNPLNASQSIEISGGTVNVVTYGGKGVNISGDLTMNGGTFNIDCSQTKSSYCTGLYAGNTITVNGGKLSVNDATSFAINPSGSLVMNGGEIYARNKKDTTIYCGNSATVSGGKMTIVCDSIDATYPGTTFSAWKGVTVNGGIIDVKAPAGATFFDLDMNRVPNPGSIIYLNGVGTVNGTVTLTEDHTIPEGATLTVPDGATLNKNGFAVGPADKLIVETDGTVND